MTIAKTWKEGGHLKRETEDQHQVPRGEGSWTTALRQRIGLRPFNKNPEAQQVGRLRSAGVKCTDRGIKRTIFSKFSSSEEPPPKTKAAGSPKHDIVRVIKVQRLTSNR